MSKTDTEVEGKRRVHWLGRDWSPRRQSIDIRSTRSAPLQLRSLDRNYNQNKVYRTNRQTRAGSLVEFESLEDQLFSYNAIDALCGEVPRDEANFCKRIRLLNTIIMAVVVAGFTAALLMTFYSEAMRRRAKTTPSPTPEYVGDEEVSAFNEQSAVLVNETGAIVDAGRNNETFGGGTVGFRAVRNGRRRITHTNGVVETVIKKMPDERVSTVPKTTTTTTTKPTKPPPPPIREHKMG